MNQHHPHHQQQQHQKKQRSTLSTKDTNTNTTSSSTTAPHHHHHKRRLATLTEPSNKCLLLERDAQILALRTEVVSLKNHLLTLHKKHKSQRPRNSSLAAANGNPTTPKRSHRLTPYGNTVHETITQSGSSSYLTHERKRMGRNASISTAQELQSLANPNEQTKRSANEQLVRRILDMFKDPTAPVHMAYLASPSFARDLLRLNAQVRQVFEAEPRVVFLQSPAYVFGDIHGNLEDLHFFSDNIWRLGMGLTAGNFVFLGDYVDRGMSCLECVAYLFAMKLLSPHKVFLLRGNHETRDVNGWQEHYGERSFIAQCRVRFGDDLGYKVWEQTNQVFDRLPLAAVIDQDIFCVHGGIPRVVGGGGGTVDGGLLGGGGSSGSGEGEYHSGHRGKKAKSRIQEILKVPKVAGINPPYEHEQEQYQQIASDCIWSDPASEDQEKSSIDPHSGYGESLRGGGAICFGQKAVTEFLHQHGFSYIMRAHEAHADGVAVSKGGKVFTIFSTSKDHNQGNEAMAGCILVDFEQMQVINRSPAYKNQYVHRRDSVSIEKLTETEVQKRMQLGLVTDPSEEDEEEEEEEEYYEDDDDDKDGGDGDGDEGALEEEWDDIMEEGDEEDESDDEVGEGGQRQLQRSRFDDSDDEDDCYTLSKRKSSVDPIQTVASPQGQKQQQHESPSSPTSQGHMRFDFVDTVDRKKKHDCRFSMIPEEDSSTLNGEDAMDFEDETDSDN